MIYAACMNDAKRPSSVIADDESAVVMCRVCDHRFRVEHALDRQMDGQRVACPNCGQQHQLFVYWFDHSIAIGVKPLYQ